MGGWEIFKVSLHSWQRGANPTILWTPPPPPILPPLTPLFQILSTPPQPLTPLPCYLQPTPPLFLLLFLWLNGWSQHIWCAIILLNDNMNLHMSSLGTLEPEGACVRFMQLGVTFSEVWHNVIFYWYSDLIPPTPTHTVHSGASRLANPYEHIFIPPPVMWSQQLPLLH